MLKTILIVDDEKDLREILYEEFTRENFIVVQASSVTEALSLLTNNNIDVILSDYRMPGGNGIQLFKLTREIKEVPFFLLTGFADVSIDEAQRLGISGVFSKPFDLQEIVNNIKGHL